jgi:ribose-phosphate pyrophosphokinase
MEIKLFGLNSTRDYAVRLADHLGLDLSRHREYYFDDGEAFCCPDENVRGRDVFIVQSLYEDDKESVNDKFMKLLIMIGAATDASARRVTVVCPYYCYARQDKKNTSRAPITTKYMAAMLRQAGADRFLALDVHSRAAQQNAFHIPADLLEARPLFDSFISGAFSGLPITIVSPDPGGLERVTKLMHKVRLQHNDVDVGCVYKTHFEREIKANGIMGNLAGRHVIIFDDMISSGTTTKECVAKCLEAGAASIKAVIATHGLFVGNANDNLDIKQVEKIVVCDSVPPFRITNERVKEKLVILSTAALIGDAIRCTHKNLSVSSLFE